MAHRHDRRGVDYTCYGCKDPRYASDKETRDMEYPLLNREYQVIAEGVEWEDSDGRTTWPYDEAEHVAQRVRDNGYNPVEVV